MKRWGAGSTNGEEGIVLLPRQSPSGWDSRVWMVLKASMPGKHSLEPQAKSSKVLRRK